MPHPPDLAEQHPSAPTPDYARASRNIEKRLKQFLREWHGKAKELDLSHFKPQEFNLEMKGDSYEEMLKGAHSLGKNEEITNFNRDFLELFKEILLVSAPENPGRYVPNKDLLWAAILEAKPADTADNYLQEQGPEEFNYSLFCFPKNQPNSDNFFNAHRMYQRLEKGDGKILKGLTDVLLHEGKKEFKPLYVGVRPNLFGTSSKKDPHESSTLAYQESNGILLDEGLTREVDDYLNESEVRALLQSRNEKEFLKAIVETHRNVVRSRQFFKLTDPSEAVKKASEAVEFVYYLIWLRAMGVVGGAAAENWVDYFYFRVPDLSGYLHVFTVASKERLNPILFELIDREAPSLFHRSLLRLAIRQKELRQEVETHARRAAVVAVMSRNMSHNIGSHVLARLSSKEDLVFTPELNTQLSTIPLAQIQEDCLRDVGVLNSYLQARMDFLADLATSVPVVTLPNRLYADLCVYLKPSSSDDRDLLEDRWQRLLMSRISAVPEVGAEKINLAVKLSKDGREENIELRSLKDPVIASPNDILGGHALYVILENIIRNAAKHSKINESLDITIRVVEEEDYWNITVFDNLEEFSRVPNLDIKLNEKIAEKILKSDASLRLGGWGMLEMKIAAAYLRKILPEQIDEKHDPTLLRAINYEGNLGLEFYLLKHKEALVVELEGKSFQPLKEHVKSFGVDIISPTDKKLSIIDARHDFLIIVSSTEEDLKAFQLTPEMLPSRIFVCRDHITNLKNRLDKSEFLKILSTGTATEVREYLWQKWHTANTESGQSVTIKLARSAQNVETLFNESESAKKIIFFDSHGNSFGKHGTPAAVAYYEPYATRSPTGLLLNWLPKDPSKKRTLMYELSEAAQLRIVVVDERIQEASTSECTLFDGINGVTHSDILQWMRIRIPEPAVVDLNKQKLYTADVIELENYLEPLSEWADVLLIHLGVVEKWLGSTDEPEIAKWLSHWKKRFRKVVITSGRGRPPNLPDSALFVHYSLVSRYLFQERNKYHLCKVLFASRRIPR